ncbi:hypothetical protein C2E23DRAFT_724352 [Lenzites betulinus]|nr:hypothetical protein C2E23DRAFT_724352 [Lenzites betulinus]
MSPKRKNGAAKPPAQPKPPAPTAKSSQPAPPAPPPPKPAPAPPAPPVAPTAQRVSPPPPPNAGPSRSGVTIQTNPVAPPPRAPAQPPKPSTQPARSALAPHLRNAPAPPPFAAHAARMGSSQKHAFTRSDRVRAQWIEFEASWVSPHQKKIEQELSELFKVAERTAHAKGKLRADGTPDGMDKIVNSMQRDFALAARAEWDSRLERAGLQAEDWTDITPQEMLEVEQVLSYDESYDEPGVYAQVQQHGSYAATGSSGSTATDTTPPTAARSLSGWSSRAPQKTHASQPLRNTQTVAARHAAMTEDEPTKPAHTWGTKSAPIDDYSRSHSKQSPAAVPITPAASSSSRVSQPATKPVAAAIPVATMTDLLAYAVPVALTQPPLDATLTANAEYMSIVDKLFYNSIRQFHGKAAEADVELARQLRKPMPAADREFTIRAHIVAMEQSARDIVTRRNQLLDEERKKRGLGDNGGPSGDSAPPPPATVPARPTAVPGAFPEERPRPARRPEPEPEPLLEYIGETEPEPEPEREPDEDVDEVIEIPIKGKGKGKAKGKKAAVETKPTTNGRSTPTPAAAKSAPKVAPAAPAPKATPAPETKGKYAAAAAPLAAWNTAKTAAPARAASPAPINTKVGLAAPANGRNSPATGAPSSSGLSPWEMLQAKSASGSASAADQKAAASQNGMWAPPVARGGSNGKNPFAPTRPSRLAQVTKVPDTDPVPASPESPEPPSPPANEPSGRDYVAWFAGSSSEDDESMSGDPLDEDEDEDDDDEEEEAEAAGSAGFGGLLASLAGASPWALFGENQQPQKARAASPARGRGATPTPARAAPAEPAYARWAMPAAGPSAGPSAAPGMWKKPDSSDNDEAGLDSMLEIAASALGNAAMGGQRAGGVHIEEAMAMYVTASKARDTLATPVGGRSGRRR